MEMLHLFGKFYVLWLESGLAIWLELRLGLGLLQLRVRICKVSIKCCRSLQNLQRHRVTPDRVSDGV